MFEFFKKKIKDAFSKFTRRVDEEAKEVEEPGEGKPIKEEAEVKEEEPKKEEKKPEAKKEEKKEKKKEPEAKKEVKKEEKKEEPKEKKTEAKKEEKKEEPKKEPEVKEAEDKKEEPPVPAEDKKEEPKKSFFDRINIFKKKAPEEKEEKPKEKKHEKGFEEEYVEKEKKTFIEKISDSITKKTISERKFNDIFWDLEIALLENNVAVEVVDLLKKELKEKLVDKPLPRSKISETIEKTLKQTVEKIFELQPIDLVWQARNKKPYKILIMGINGSGKTTTIAKLCRLFQKEHLKPVIAASDTFRAAAIDQLQEHADKLNVKMIKHDYGSDPAAVAFDAIKFAEAKAQDIVIIDTAGRLHSNVNLMDELKKVHRVSNPDFVLFVGESITGNDCVEQAKEFNKAVPIDGIILSKADIDEKGGAAISISYVLGKPILYLGVGQNYEDLEVFDKYKIMYRMFGTELGKGE